MELGMFVLALLAPMVLGTAVLSRLWGDRGYLVLIGYGYMLGMALLIFALKVQHWLGIGQGLAGTLTAMLLLSAGLYVVADRLFSGNRTGVPDRSGSIGSDDISRIEMIAVTALLGLLAFRFVVIGYDNALRPMFPWDAWETYGAIAKLWLAKGGIVDFGTVGQWVREDAAYPVYPSITPSNKALGHVYILYWTALPFDQWRDDLVTFPWVLCALAMGAGVYGQFRNLGVGAVVALILVYFLLSLPLLNAHVILGGYPEIWAGSALGLAAGAYLMWRKTRLTRDLIVALVMAGICTLFEQVGIYWAAILGVAMLVDSLAMERWRRVGYSLLGILAVAVVVSVVTGHLFAVTETAGEYRLDIPLVGTREVAFNNVTGAMLESLFLSSNWHLFWWMAVLAILIGALSKRRKMFLYGPALILVLMALALHVEYFWIETYSSLVSEKTVFDRTLVPLAPTVLILLGWWLFSGKHERT